MTAIRVVQWNISTGAKSSLVAAFLQEHLAADRPTVVCLNEVLESAFAALRDELEPTASVFSLELREPGRHEGRNRRMGIAVLSFGSEITDFRLLDRTVFPERSLRVELDVAGTRVRVCAFHSLTGVGYKNAKASNFMTIADHLEADTELDFLCFDANEPKTDARDEAQLEFWDGNGDRGRGASLIMGPDRPHHLTDSYRSFQQHPDILEPLPETHLTRGNPRRYDYVFTAPWWSVTSIDHPFEASVAASSDHSAVIVDAQREPRAR